MLDFQFGCSANAQAIIPSPLSNCSGREIWLCHEPRDAFFYVQSQLPPNSQWAAAFGISRMAFPMVAQSWLLGGHCRVGLEDAVYLSRGVLTPNNAALISKAKRIIEDLGGTVATVAEGREILGL